MSYAKVKITGVPQKTPKMKENGDVVLIFKTEQGEETISANCNYMVTVEKELWGRVSKDVEEKSFYLIEGIPKAGVSGKGLPFVGVICTSIKIINGFEEDEQIPGSLKLPDKLPKDTDEMVAVSDIKIPENISEPTRAKKIAWTYFKKNGTFKNAITVKKENMTLVKGHADYLVAQELGISKVPVSYNLFAAGESKDEKGFDGFIWYDDDEVTEMRVKDIILMEDIHTKVQNFVFKMGLDEIIQTGKITMPIAVRPAENGKYSLVTGVARYFAAKILDVETIPVVITDLKHDEFIKSRFESHKDTSDNEANGQEMVEETTLLSLIAVPKTFLNTKPNPAKVEEVITYYKKHGQFDKPIVIQGAQNLLVDGYKRYIAAQQMNLKSVWTKKKK